jgi:hypothetical protein
MSIPKAVMWGCVVGFLLRCALPSISLPLVNMQQPASPSDCSVSRGFELTVNGKQRQFWMKITTAKTAGHAEAQH